MTTYQLTPLDTLFFRDGRPFNLGETGQMEVEAVFPPSPTTVVGALRAALARANGWNGRGGWLDDIKAQLGDGDDLRALRFSGPHLLRDGEALFPAPLLLLGKKPREKAERWSEFRRLVPAGNSLQTDVGVVSLPKPDGATDGHKVLERCWLTKDGMETVLNGSTPSSEDVHAASDLWKPEPRVGIRRDPGSRTTKEDSLYNIQHVRLHRGASLAITVEGTAWQPQSPALLGGESRMVWIEPLVGGLQLPEKPKLTADGGKIRYVVSLITPAHLLGRAWAEPGGRLGDLPGTVVSACVGKPVMIGGWNSLHHEPLPLKPHLPAGSTWFLEAPESEAQHVLDMHGKHIVENPAWGYGQILIGTWREQ